MDIAAKLTELGLELPKPAAPVAAYVPTVEAGGLLHISGQLPFRDGQVVTGRLGTDMDEATGYDAARRCALMLVAQIGQALGGIELAMGKLRVFMEVREQRFEIFVIVPGDRRAQVRLCER